MSGSNYNYTFTATDEVAPQINAQATAFARVRSEANETTQAFGAAGAAGQRYTQQLTAELNNLRSSTQQLTRELRELQTQQLSPTSLPRNNAPGGGSSGGVTSILPTAPTTALPDQNLTTALNLQKQIQEQAGASQRTIEGLRQEYQRLLSQLNQEPPGKLKDSLVDQAQASERAIDQLETRLRATYDRLQERSNTPNANKQLLGIDLDAASRTIETQADALASRLQIIGRKAQDALQLREFKTGPEASSFFNTLSQQAERSTETITRLRAAQSELQRQLAANPNLRGYEAYQHRIEELRLQIERLERQQQSAFTSLNGSDVTPDNLVQKFGQLRTVANQLNTGSAGLGESIRHVGQQMLGAKQEATGLSAAFQGLLSRAVGVASGIVVGFAISGVISGLQQLLEIAEQVYAFSVKTAAGFEQERLSLVRLNGDVAEGNKQFSDLQDLAAKGLDFTGLTQIASQLASLNIRGERSVEIITALGNELALRGKTDKLEQAGLALTQIISLGRLQGQEARQLSQINIDPYKQVADYLGVSVTKARQLGEEGLITADTYVKALVADSQRYGDVLTENSKTLNGQVAILQKQGQQLGAVFGNPSVAVFESHLENINALLGTDDPKNFVNVLGFGLAVIADKALTTVERIGILLGYLASVGQQIPGLEGLGDFIAGLTDTSNTTAAFVKQQVALARAAEQGAAGLSTETTATDALNASLQKLVDSAKEYTSAMQAAQSQNSDWYAKQIEPLTKSNDALQADIAATRKALELLNAPLEKENTGLQAQLEGIRAENQKLNDSIRNSRTGWLDANGVLHKSNTQLERDAQAATRETERANDAIERQISLLDRAYNTGNIDREIERLQRRIAANEPLAEDVYSSEGASARGQLASDHERLADLLAQKDHDARKDNLEDQKYYNDQGLKTTQDTITGQKQANDDAIYSNDQATQNQIDNIQLQIQANKDLIASHDTAAANIIDSDQSLIDSNNLLIENMRKTKDEWDLLWQEMAAIVQRNAAIAQDAINGTEDARERNRLNGPNAKPEGSSGKGGQSTSGWDLPLPGEPGFIGPVKPTIPQPGDPGYIGPVRPSLFSGASTDLSDYADAGMTVTVRQEQYCPNCGQIHSAKEWKQNFDLNEDHVAQKLGKRLF